MKNKKQLEREVNILNDIVNRNKLKDLGININKIINSINNKYSNINYKG